MGKLGDGKEIELQDIRIMEIDIGDLVTAIRMKNMD